MEDYLKKTIDIYNSIAEDYASRTRNKAPVIQRNKFLSLLPNKAVVLDLGCGSGRDSKFFSDHGCNVIGIDLAEKLLEIAQKTAPEVHFLKQDIRAIDLPFESVDGVWTCASLLHIKREELPSVLNKIYQILRPNGVVFIHLKKGKGEEERIEPSTPGIKRLFVFYEVDELTALIKQAGLTLLTCYEPKKSKDEKTQWISCFAKKSG